MNNKAEAIQELIDELVKCEGIDCPNCGLLSIKKENDKEYDIILQALKTALEIEQGKAFVARWVEADRGHTHDWDEMHIVSEKGSIHLTDFLDARDGDNYLMTFNGSASITQPKEEE